MSDALPQEDAAPAPGSIEGMAELIVMGIKLKLQFMAFGAAVVLVVWFLCRSPTRSRESDYEVDETGRRRKIMHGDL